MGTECNSAYLLTRRICISEQSGIDLLPLMIEINLWTEKYFTIPTEHKSMLKEVKKDKEKFIKIATRELKKSKRHHQKLTDCA